VHLGFGLVTCQQNPQDPEKRSDADLYAQALELARLCEGAGLASYWVSEHHFVDDGYLPGMLVTLAAAAAVTERILLGTGVLLAPLWHPMRVAEDAATVDLLSRGRLILGLGLGWREEEFEGFGVEPKRKVRLLEDMIPTLRAAWTEGELAGPGGVHVTPKPHRRGGPPIWLGGFVEAAVARAARIADGYFASVTTLDALRSRVEVLRDAAEGRAVTVAGHVPVFMWDGPEDPWSLVRQHYWYIRWKYTDMGAARGRTGPPPYAPLLDDAQEQELRKNIVVGRPEEVIAQLRPFAELISDDGHLVARSYFPGLPWELQKRQVELLGEIAAALR